MQVVDKSVLITGAISGLGLALIEAFLKAGARANICRVSRSRPACAKSPPGEGTPYGCDRSRTNQVGSSHCRHRYSGEQRRSQPSAAVAGHERTRGSSPGNGCNLLCHAGDDPCVRACVERTPRGNHQRAVDPCAGGLADYGVALRLQGGRIAAEGGPAPNWPVVYR